MPHLVGLNEIDAQRRLDAAQMRRKVNYVSAPQVNLRDRLSAVYNKVATVKNGERVEVLEHQRRFVRVRTASGSEGWKVRMKKLS